MRYKYSKKILGKGVYGEVVKCTSEAKEPFACKILKDGLEHCSALREIATCALLSRSFTKHTINIRGFKIIGQIRIVMEEAPLSLCDWAFETPKRERLKMFPKIMDLSIKTLSEMHALELIHCDVKPENFLIFIRDRQIKRIKLVDFGITTAFPDKDHTFIYTYCYRSPEVWLEDRASKASDVWALGVTMLLVTSGYSLHTAVTNVKNYNLVEVIKINDECLQNLEKSLDPKRFKILKKMLEPDSKKRYKLPEPDYVVPPKRVWNTDAMDAKLFKWLCDMRKKWAFRFTTLTACIDLYLCLANLIETNKKHAGICLMIASKWGETYPLEYPDIVGILNISSKEAKEMETEIIIKMECLVWIPGLDWLTELLIEKGKKLFDNMDLIINGSES